MCCGWLEYELQRAISKRVVKLVTQRTPRNAPYLRPVDPKIHGSTHRVAELGNDLRGRNLSEEHSDLYGAQKAFLRLIRLSGTRINTQ
jgi:hypothetical protein